MSSTLWTLLHTVRIAARGPSEASGATLGVDLSSTPSGVLLASLGALRTMRKSVSQYTAHSGTNVPYFTQAPAAYCEQGLMASVAKRDCLLAPRQTVSTYSTIFVVIYRLHVGVKCIWIIRGKNTLMEKRIIFFRPNDPIFQKQNHRKQEIFWVWPYKLLPKKTSAICTRHILVHAHGTWRKR